MVTLQQLTNNITALLIISIIILIIAIACFLILLFMFIRKYDIIEKENKYINVNKQVDKIIEEMKRNKNN